MESVLALMKVKIMAMSPSSPGDIPLDFYARCWKCDKSISSNSMFAIQLWLKDDILCHDTVRSKMLQSDSMAMHMSGDRECAKEVSGFHGRILKRLDLPISYNTEFLDSL